MRKVVVDTRYVNVVGVLYYLGQGDMPDFLIACLVVEQHCMHSCPMINNVHMSIKTHLCVLQERNAQPQKLIKKNIRRTIMVFCVIVHVVLNNV